MTWSWIKQLLTFKIFWILVNIVFTALLTVQLSHVLQGYIKPQTTRTWDEYARLEDMKFPLVIKICVIPGFNQTALQELGYKDTYSYFLGREDSYNDNHTYGWAGHTKDLGTVKEVLAKVGGHQIEKIIEFLYVDKDYTTSANVPLEYLKVTKVNFPNNCHSLDLSEVSELNGTRYNQLFIKFRELREHKIAVQFKGKSLNTDRNIREHSLRSTGDDIIVKEENVTKAYTVEITERHFVEEDPINGCRDYPNPEYASYDECDNQFMRKTLPGLTPVWITEVLEEVTIQKIDEDRTYGKGDGQILFAGLFPQGGGGGYPLTARSFPPMGRFYSYLIHKHHF